MTCRTLLTLTLTAAVYAQDPVVEAGLSEQLRLAERALQRVTVDVERLVDMRMRFDLGLLDELDEDVVRVDTGTSTREMDRMREVLADLRARNTVLAGEHDVARRVYAERTSAGAAPAAAPAGPFVPVPAPGDRVSVSSPRVAATLDAGETPPAPGGEVRPTTVGPEDLGPLALDPIRAQIHGSTDRLCIARALFQAGQALMERAAALRRHGRADAAAQLDARGYQRLERALVELAPLVDPDDAPLAALFYQSRCLELLFRHDERYPDEEGETLSLSGDARRFNERAQQVRDPLLRITAPEEESRPSTEADKAWRAAANTALENFRWVNIHAAYDATARIEAVTWPGERRR